MLAPPDLVASVASSLTLWQVVLLLGFIVFVVWTAILNLRPHPDGIPKVSFEWPLIGDLPTSIWWAGHTLELDIRDHKQAGPVFAFNTLWYSSVSLCEPEDIKHILYTNFKNYPKGPIFYNFFKQALGNGIFNADGERWKHQRSTARPLFRTESLNEMQPHFQSGADYVVNTIFKEAAQHKTVIDVQDIFMRYTLDTIGKIGFGYEIGSLIKPVPFSAAFDYVQLEINERLSNPLREYFVYRKFSRCLKEMDDFIYGIISERRQNSAVALSGKTDLLSRYLLMTDPTTAQPFTDQYLRDILINFVIAGRDTTAILLTWTCYRLSQHPLILKKVLVEVGEVVGQDPPSCETLEKLKYLDAVLNETLRLHPSVPANMKLCLSDDILPSGFKLRKGYNIFFNAYTVHRLEKYWGPDVEEFRPERWLDEKFVNNMHPFQYFPFHGGPRTCLGNRMAIREAKTMLCTIFQRYTLTLQPGHKVQPQESILMPAMYGMKMLVHPRDKASAEW
jgi:cytochrome P450